MAGWAATILVGAVSGLLAGMFGIGGGLVTTPAIRLVLGRAPFIAVGTPLAVIIPTAVAGVASHARGGGLDWRTGLIVGLAGAPLTLVGAWFSGVVGGPAVLVLTAVLILGVAVTMFVSPRPARPRDEDGPGPPLDVDARPTATPLPVARGAAIGLLAGAYSGFLGLGGGFVIVPLLVRWAGQDIKRATAASLLAVGILAVPGSIAHSALGHVDWGLALALAVGSVPGAWVGAALARRLSSATLTRAFAVLLAVAGVVLALNEVL